MTLLKSKTIDDYIEYRKDYGGWNLVNRTSEGAQFTKPKEYSPVLFWLGLLTCWIYGLGVLIWIIGAIGYVAGEKELFYVDIRQMEKELAARTSK